MLRDLPVPLDLAPMEAKLVDEIPRDGGWRFEPKWDGFRCLAYRDGDEVLLKAKSGKPLNRFFPDMVAALAALPIDRFVLDGELTIAVDGEPSFEALQMRLHPAESRVRKLAAEQPAAFMLFDCLMDADGAPLLEAPLTDRRKALEALFKRLGKAPALRLSPGSTKREEACTWLEDTGSSLDGVVAKRLDGPYVPGERAMLKIKKIRTADCVVGGFRYAEGTEEVGSLLLGLYDAAGRLNHVGFTSTIKHAERPALTRKLLALKGQGFTGDAPGGPSRWSSERSAQWVPLAPELVVEVRYDQVTGGRFRHGTRLVRWRPDKAPGQCTMEQIRPR
ncbi:MAG: ATP-dependent DNA ligase [Phenylobacterium sp. RIFCSPHIGHO2_01_FULL_69_31]|uniref:ATP-dependent DNA ligase n=1 Tax=Phenylobacterium sp. RIFCSPHIGHO2_01_FULL_69_31 TaxID=1801944 RepID=UPI0008B0943E|nr:ATP-dependent DNA ligase [Phenylobacterium sp. RIFCSPHIGHO2_01_FULL_69_31]OHB27637.1 MAG: ATP-dependent DNA ligase [Phenylobacterium sp. RIFCSPHIGHO2_01_FULL_69_31]